MQAGGRLVVGIVIVLALSALLPPHLNGNWVHVLTLFFMMSSLAQAWNLIGGFTGYASFGNVTFFGTGAYACAYAMDAMRWPFWTAALFAVVVAAALAALLGWPILRLRGHYFAIATLSIAVGMQALVAQQEPFGKGSGMTLPINPNFHFFYWVMLGILIVSILLTAFIARSRFGYALVAIRENEEAAAVLGINAARAKVAAWAISAAITGAAGATFAYWNTFIDPPTVFDLNYNVLMIIMTLLGGAGTIVGPTIGSFILSAIGEYLGAQSISPWHTVVLGAIIVFIVILLPRGLMPYLTGGLRAFNLGALRAQLRASRV
ncbi:MAG: branched-chain amino acid ABC transporter permease [Candidatus Eremiobacteraeota bacterium]|nr:branched-chain amino acid ABC transporter permease [Candidatus Eremiobacteraeota bacterium]